MKITDGAHIDIGLSRLVKNDRLAGAANRAEGAPGRPRDAARVTISDDAQHLQEVAALAQAGDELRAHRVNDVSEQVSSGTFHVEPSRVAESALRSDVSRLLGA